MPLHGPKPTDGDDCYLEFGRILEFVRRRVRYYVSEIDQVKSPDNVLLPSIMALRLLMEGDPKACDGFLAKSELETWEVAYLKMFERTKRKIPKKVSPEKVKQNALAEFKKLRKLAEDTVNHTPEAWLPEVKASLRMAEHEMKFYSNLPLDCFS